MVAAVYLLPYATDGDVGPIDSFPTSETEAWLAQSDLFLYEASGYGYDDPNSIRRGREPFEVHLPRFDVAPSFLATARCQDLFIDASGLQRESYFNLAMTGLI